MRSNWYVREVELIGNTYYEVYRTTDAAKEKDHIETRGGYWSTKEEAETLAARLNEKEENKWNRWN